jgi:preprotein translocase SecE subunit
VARDRKRTRPRSSPAASAPADDGDQPLASVPAPLQHTGEVDEFDAQLVHGAELAGELDEGGEPVIDEAELAKESEEAAAAAFGGGGGRGRGRRPVTGDGDGSGAGAGGAGMTAPGAAAPAVRKRSLFSRAIAFLQASWAELQRVQWPDRRQVAQATAVVLGFVAIAGIYLGAADWVAQKIVNFIL